MHPALSAETIVLVEGESDRSAVLAAASVLGHELADIAVVAMGGATNVGAYVARYSLDPDVATLAALCDHGRTGSRQAAPAARRTPRSPLSNIYRVLSVS